MLTIHVVGRFIRARLRHYLGTVGHRIVGLPGQEGVLSTRSIEPKTANAISILRASVRRPVDDEAVVRRLVCAILERAGFAALAAGSGAEALDMFQQHRSDINLLLTDIIMPGMAGTALVENIRKMDTSIPVLFMSAFCDRA